MKRSYFVTKLCLELGVAKQRKTERKRTGRKILYRRNLRGEMTLTE